MRIEPTIFKELPELTQKPEPELKQTAELSKQPDHFQPPIVLSSSPPEGLLIAKILLVMCWGFPFLIVGLVVFGYPIESRLPDYFLATSLIMSAVFFYLLLAIIFHKLNRRVGVWMALSICIPFFAYSFSFLFALFLEPLENLKR